MTVGAAQQPLAQTNAIHGVHDPIIGSHVLADLIIDGAPPDNNGNTPQGMIWIAPEQGDGIAHRIIGTGQQAREPNNVGLDFCSLSDKCIGRGIDPQIVQLSNMPWMFLPMS
jgi:hypothetical protein